MDEDDLIMLPLSRENSESEEEGEREDVPYDIAQTGRHSYMGEFKDIQSSEIFYPPNTYKEDVPLFYCQFFMPTPGQRFPLLLRRFRPEDVQRITSGLIVLGHDDEFGVTVEVEALSGDILDNTAQGIKVIARQRVKILYKNQAIIGDDNTGYYKAKIVFMPEHEHDAATIVRRHHFQAIVDGVFDSHPFLPIPKVAFTSISHSNLIEQITLKMKNLYRSHDLSLSYDSASHFSYFVISCLPLHNAIKIMLTKVPTTTERLLYLLHIVSSPFIIECNNCGVAVNHSEDLIQMSPKSSSSVFVNPNGYVFELFTMKFHSTPYPVFFNPGFSWYPAYAWAIRVCPNCLNHLGWLFKAKEMTTKPRIFTTATRNSVIINFSNGNPVGMFKDLQDAVDAWQPHENISIDQ